MRNPDIKTWAWQRLWTTKEGNGEVYPCIAFTEDAPWLHTNPEVMEEDGRWFWLCPKPNLVLINRDNGNAN